MAATTITTVVSMDALFAEQTIGMFAILTIIVVAAQHADQMVGLVLESILEEAVLALALALDNYLRTQSFFVSQILYCLASSTLTSW